MDFDDTPEEAAFRRAAREWLTRNAEPAGEAKGSVIPGDADAEGVQAARAWQARKADAGWACITWPRQFGGRGGTPIQAVIWNQEEARFFVPPDIFLVGLGMAGPTLMAHGTEPQQQRWLPRMLHGDEVWCQLFSEPSAGSDLAGLRTLARRDGDSWVANGQKIWTSGAHYSKWGILVARSDPDAPKHAGLTYFVLDMESPGIEIRPIKQITGDANFSEVFLNDVRIPDENRISEVGNGWAVAITTLMNERVATGSGAGLGFPDLVEIAESAELDGRPAIEDPGVESRLADFYVRIKGLRYTRYRSLTALSRGETPGPEGSIGKLVTAPLNQEMASYAIELQGAAGAVDDREHAAMGGAWQGAYLSAPGMRIAGGTDEIMRNIIAERVLRLPPEPRVDKDLPFRDVPSAPAKGA